MQESEPLLVERENDGPSVGRIIFYEACKYALIGLALVLSTSYIVTNTLTWNYTIPKYQKLFPPTQRIFTLEELAKYDGTNSSLPLYLAIKGHVFDVSEGRDFYEPGASYHLFAGKDASRAFGSGCLKEPSHHTYDLRDLQDQELKIIDGWLEFYKHSPKYFQVGTVTLPTIDPSSPVPKSCRGSKKP